MLDAYPGFKEESTFVEDLNEIIDRYRTLLEQLAEEFPKDFILKDVLTAKEQAPPKSASETQDVTGDPSQPNPAPKKSEGPGDEPGSP